MKQKRQRNILDIIEEKAVETQDELTQELCNRGIIVTQATVSRDIKEMGLVKVPKGGDKYCYALPNDKSLSSADQRRLERLFKDSVIDLNYSENIILVKTYPGAAPSVASALDYSDISEIIGSVAGDDTILLVIKPKEAVQEILEKLDALFD
ncbi:transcriptional regulator of arginine metabolism [Desulfitispora alkaliphila]|uniref:arginine repressor n=1 Tax=Desulfitispora alkaliphila TaxID=622674 RepID=UPI003D261505